jgi:tetratricopeptide (TPR) repeat protein
MKWLFVLAGLMLLVLPPCARAEAPDDQYLEVYNLIQQGDALSPELSDQALAKYLEAQTDLQKLKRMYPDWNSKVVTFRLNYLASKIVILSARTSAPVMPSPAPAAKTPVSAVTTPVSVVTTRVSVVTAPVPAARTPVPPATTPLPAAKIQTQPSATSEVENQLGALQIQLKQLQADNMVLQAKLKEALAAQPAAADPRELAKAGETIRSLQKENNLLQVSLAQNQAKAAPAAGPRALGQAKRDLADANRRLADQTAKANALLLEKKELQDKLDGLSRKSPDANAVAAAKKDLDDSNRKLVEQTALASRLAHENETLQTRVKTLSAETDAMATMRTENESLKKFAQSKPASTSSGPADDANRRLAEAQAQLAALQSDKEIWHLEKIALENRIQQLSAPPVATTVVPMPGWPQDAARLKQIESERDELQKKLEAAQKELYGRNNKTTVARVDELTSQLDVLRARLEVFEARPVPYTAEELALFKKPDPVLPVSDAKAGKKSVKELPVGTVTMIAEAQRDFAEKRFDQAEEKYQQVLRRDDKNVNTLANLATIQLEMNHLDEAEKHIQAALALVPDDAYSLSILGNLRYRQGKYDDALDVLSRAAKLDPQNAEVQNYLGLTLSQKGLRGPAETALRKAIQLRPGYGSAHNNLAVIYVSQQPPMIELARWHYQKALAAGSPRNPDLEKLLEPQKPQEAGK